MVKQLVVESHSWRNQFGHTAFHEFLGEFRILQLVADGHLVARADKFRKIDIYGVMWESGHLDVAFVPVGFFGLDNAQNLADQYSVIRIGLVEVSDPVKQQRFGMLGFHREKLFDQRSVFRYLIFRHINVL